MKNPCLRRTDRPLTRLWDSDSPGMIYREVAPHPKLRKHIKCFWMLDHDYARSSHDHERLWADAHTELIFTSGQRYFRKVSGRTVWLPQSFVIGPFQNELELFSKGRTSLVAARFWPWGFHALSRIPMTDLRNTVRSGRQALGSECGYADQPHFTRTFREMFGITPSDFKDRLKETFRRFREKKPDVVFLQDTQAKPD